MIVGVGISGGVDSATTALLLKRAGHQVRGYTLRMTGADCHKARQVASRLDIPLFELDIQQQFDRMVLDYFAAEYACGRTPSPCVKCNRLFKFGFLLDAMRADGCDCIATGHYARIEDGCLKRGIDSSKDQSYFLAQVPSNVFPYIMFPLGNMLKSHVKQIVYEEGIVSPEEGESQDLCFVSDGNVFSIVTQRRPELLKDGDIVTMDGKVLGRHRGAFAHTIGQRRGLGLGGGPWFVVKVDIAENKVIVGRQEDLNCRHVHLSGMNWLREMPASTVRVEAQLRYLMKPRKAMLAPAGDNEAELIFEEDAPLAPEGQLAVAYDGDSVVASGWIMSSE